MLHLFKMPTDQRPSGTTKTSFQQYRLWSTSRFQKPAPCKFLGLQVQNESNRVLVALLLPILLVHLCDLFQTLLLCFETDHPLDSVLHWLLWAKIVFGKNPNPTKHMGCFLFIFLLKVEKTAWVTLLKSGSGLILIWKESDQDWSSSHHWMWMLTGLITLGCLFSPKKCLI